VLKNSGRASLSISCTLSISNHAALTGRVVCNGGGAGGGGCNGVMFKIGALSNLLSGTISAVLCQWLTSSVGKTGPPLHHWWLFDLYNTITSIGEFEIDDYLPFYHGHYNNIPHNKIC
jgi:hypothetical protein